jgi:regulatory protein
MGIRSASDLPTPGRRERDSRPGGSRGSRRGDALDRIGDGPAGGEETTEPKPRRRKIDSMDREEQITYAKEIALLSLSMVARTRSQLETKLASKELPADVIAAALDRLAEVGLVDDASFAAQWVSSRQGSRGLSEYAIRRELQQKGVDADLIDDALAHVTAEDEEAQALELARRKAASTRTLDVQARTRRIAGHLARKGYGGQVAFAAAKQAITEDLADNPPQ